MTPKTQLKPQEPDVDLSDAIEQLRIKKGIPKSLVDRLVNQESGGRENVVSPKGAQGSFQVMPATFDLYNKKVGGKLNRDNPLDRAYVGLSLLQDNYKQFKNYAKNDRHLTGMALAGYHAGPENVMRDLRRGGNGIPDTSDGLINTRDYVYNIMSGLKSDEPATPETIETQDQTETGIAGEQRKLKTPKVTSEVRDYEPEKLEPLKFQPGDNSELNKVARSVQGLSDRVAMQGMELPKNYPNLVGQHLEARFKEKPTEDQVESALLEQLGKGYGEVGARFRSEMGAPLVSGAAVEQLPDGSWVAHARPTQGFVDALNAYSQGGRSAYEAMLNSQTAGKAAVARDVNQELKRGEGVAQDLGQAGAREVGRSAQFIQNLGDLVRGQAPEDDPNARAIARATESIPSQKTNIGALAEIPLEAAGAITRAEALGGTAGFPASAAIERAQAGPEAAYKAGVMTAPMLAAGPIAESIGANEMAPLTRQVATRGIAGAGMAAPAIASGESPWEVGKAAAIGAAFPVGKRGEVERSSGLRRGEDAKVETQPNVTAQPESAESGQAERITQSATSAVRPEEVPVATEARGLPVEPLPRHVDLQSRRQRGNGKGQFKSETRAQREERLAQVNQPATEPQKPAPQLPVEGAPQSTPLPSSVPFMITRKMRADLGARGYSKSAIDKMTPQQANDVLAQPVTTETTATRPSVEGEASPELQALMRKAKDEWGIILRPTKTGGYEGEFGTMPLRFKSDADALLGLTDFYKNVVGEKPSSPSIEPTAKPEVQTPSESTPTAIPEVKTEPPTTSARKAQVDADRVGRGVEPLPWNPKTKSDAELLESAKAANAKSPDAPQVLVQEVLSKARALSDRETVQIDLRRQELKNRHAELLEEIGTTNDPAELSAKRAEFEAVENESDAAERAWRASGTEKGRGLRAQQIIINQDFDLLTMLNRYKAKTGKAPSPEIRAQIETQQKRIAELEKQLAEKSIKGGVGRIAREVRRENRQRTRKVLDEEAVLIRSNLSAEFARLKTQRNVAPSGLAGLDPEGVITKLALKYAKNRFEAGLTDASQLVDDVHGVLSEFADVTKRQVAEMVSGYGLPKTPETKESLEKTLTDLRKEMRDALRKADIEAGVVSAKPEGPRLSEGVGRKEGPRLTEALKVGPKETKKQIQSRYQKQINEIERRIREQDFGPRTKRGPTVLDSETRQIQVELERAKQDFQRKLREWESSQRSKAEKTADLIVNWARAAKLSYVSTLGKLSGAATGRMAMSPLENLIGEIPHRLLPELSRRATTEGGGFNKAAEVAALWKSGRFRQVLDQLTKGGSDLDVLFGPQGKRLDKEMHGRGLLGVPGRAHGALKEYPRQAEFDRAREKVLRNYEREGRDITRPDVQLAANMEAFNSAERARFQQRNFISDTFNDAMRSLEKKGLAGKAASKAGRFIFPITRVPVNVVGETLNYSFGLPRAVIETAIRGGVKNLTPEQANNIMRAYKKGGVGLAVMTYAFLHPQQFGGYYQPHDKRDPDEPHPGEVMFFGKRIPKVFTHIPILEAAQLAATSRRVMDKLLEKGESETGALKGGAVAAGAGLASQIPFYETPGRIREGLTADPGRLAGQQVKGMIPGFVQEAARVMDKNDQGETVSRKRSGLVEEIQEGLPYLRRRLPESQSERLNFKDRLLHQKRKGQIVDLDKSVESGKITEADRKAIEKQSQMTPFQVTFENTYGDKALDRYERLVKAGDPRAREVEDIMAKKAWSLINSDSLTQKQKDSFQQRIDALGITPKNPQKKSGKFIPSFRSRFTQRLGATP